MTNAITYPAAYNVLSCEEMTYTEGGVGVVEAAMAWFPLYGWYKAVSAIHDYRKLEKEIRKVNIITFDEKWFCDKTIVTFDDVITRGITWATYSDQLEQLGAHVIGGIFLAKTHYKVNEQ